MAEDEYEKTIAASGDVVFRDKVVSRSTFYACLVMGCFFLALAAGAAAQGAVAGSLGVGAFGAAAVFLALTRSILRTVVTRDDIRIRWGLWGPTIALASIRSVRVRNATRQATVEAAREQGRPRIEVFQIPAPAPIVEIEWTDGTGKARRAWVGSSDASGLAAAIDHARGASPEPEAAAPARIAEAARDEHYAVEGSAVEAEAELPSSKVRSTTAASPLK